MDKACIQIKTKEDERRWKEFLSTYFPNHYSKRILRKDLTKSPSLIGISPKGYGYITHRLAHYGQYQEIKDFSQFQATHCYRAILSQGPSLEEGDVEIITIKP